MEFPKRNISHVSERKALKILGNYLPEKWVIREMTERDYGIDLYVEIVNKTGHVTGHLTAIQVKGVQSLKFKDKKSKFRKIKRSTFNYWLGLPVPVFLVVVDLSASKPYWCSINEEHRKMKKEDDFKENVLFSINREQSFDKVGLLIFQLTYLREKSWTDIQDAVIDALMLYNTLGPFFLYCMRQPQDKVASTTIQYLLIKHYEIFCILNRYLKRFKSKTLDLPEWFDKHISFVKQSKQELTGLFRYHTIMEMLRYFIGDYWNIIQYSYKLVTEYEAHYWYKTKPYIIAHLNSNPPIFIEEDWFARYYFDEYENETYDLAHCFFEDLNL